jgi:glycine dehydrogenase subunit 1
MRYLPLDEIDRALMLQRIGASTIDDLFADVPVENRIKGDVALPRGQSELAVERALVALSKRTKPASAMASFLGAGAYRHHVPASVDHLIQRSEFLTSYTPYQPEIAQGTLQMLFEFQTQVAQLTGMEVANASMYDGSTACLEAITMAHRLTGRDKALLSGGLHPHYADTASSFAALAGHKVIALPLDPSGDEAIAAEIDAATSCIVVQSPDVFGRPRDLATLAKAAQAKGALLIAVVTEALAFAALEAPGALGADIVVAEGQSFGNAVNFGGPYVGFFATRAKFVRQMPGRLAGETLDSDGKRAFVLTLSTREQHIRREKATSNICTNSGLCALAASIHLSLLGEAGLQRLARVNHANAVDLASRLAALPGVRVVNDTFFNEFTLRLPRDAADVVEELVEDGVLAGVPVSRLAPDAGQDDLLIVACTELNTPEERDAYAQALAARL